MRFDLAMTFASTSGGLLASVIYLCRGRRELEVWFLSIRHPILQEGGWLAPLCGRFALGKERMFIGQEAGQVSGPVWAVRKIWRSTGIRSPDHPALNDSLYRLRNPSRHFKDIFGKTRRFQLLAYFII